MDSFNTSRRLALKALGSTSALGLAGCCGLAQRELQDVATPRAVSDVRPILQRSELTTARDAALPCVDAHSHFFNAKDVPVRAFLQKSIAHGMPSSIQMLLALLAPAIEAVAHEMAPSAAEEWKDLHEKQRRFAPLSPSAIAAQLDGEAAARATEVGKALYRETRRRAPEAIALFDSLARDAERSGTRSGIGIDRFSEETLIRVIRESHEPAEPRVLDERVDVRARTRASSLRSVAEFAGFMLSPRYQNLNAYMRVYGGHTGAIRLTGCYAALVDFNYWLDCPDVSTHMEDQVILHAELSRLSGGFMQPLAPYNPWVDMKEKGASLALVRKAIKHHRFVGAKLYPPMGFLPYGNAAARPLASTEHRPDLQELDETLLGFFETCMNEGIPVMAHANHSMGRDAAHDDLAGPDGWKHLRDALAARPGASGSGPLRVNAGHFAGETGSPWARDFVDLAERCDGTLDLYGDTGYWDGLLQGEAAAKRLVSLLSAKSPAPCRMADKLMFGSDWLMLSQVPGWKGYLRAVEGALDGLDDHAAKLAFLSGNARRFFRQEASNVAM